MWRPVPATVLVSGYILPLKGGIGVSFSCISLVFGFPKACFLLPLVDGLVTKDDVKLENFCIGYKNSII
jgi:hypothetical protein